eukprot:TRINITY_DN4358_c0_g1_i1.p1 TRINITY_DN4358_c0_g1~~TRINITY_DN4358_c0_g1_i1.p1  ORF type:complete len:471 (+),score=91.04 TRINITY_DN4358_c0_g1_i1:114-1526(+)
MAAPTEGQVEALHMHECDWIGFDLDHCLVRYNVPELTSLIHTCIVKFLVDQRDYNPSLRDIDCTSEFFVKGLLYDTELGNFLRLYANGTIQSCSHGTKTLDVEKARQLYAHADLAVVADNIIHHGRKNRRYFYFSTFFDMAGALAAAACVDLLDAEKASHDDINVYQKVLDDLLAAFNFNFDAAQFGKDEGYYFPALKADTDRYVHRVSGDVKDWLAALRADDVKLFILTNSHADYTKLLMDHAFGEEWYDAFDLIVFKGEKPGFFADPPETRPFYHVTKDGIKGAEAATVEPGDLFMNGNVAALIEAFKQGQIKNGELQVVYFGDHLTGDILATSKHTSWRTVAVLEELLVQVDPLAVCLGDGLEVWEQDTAMADFMQTAVARWGSFLEPPNEQDESAVAMTRDQALLYDWLMRSHSTLVVPHIHAVAELDHRHAHATVSLDSPKRGLILPRYQSSSSLASLDHGQGSI